MSHFFRQKPRPRRLPRDETSTTQRKFIEIWATFGDMNYYLSSLSSLVVHYTSLFAFFVVVRTHGSNFYFPVYTRQIISTRLADTFLGMLL